MKEKEQEMLSLYLTCVFSTKELLVFKALAAAILEEKTSHARTVPTEVDQFV